MSISIICLKRVSLLHWMGNFLRVVVFFFFFFFMLWKSSIWQTGLLGLDDVPTHLCFFEKLYLKPMLSIQNSQIQSLGGGSARWVGALRCGLSAGREYPWWTSLSLPEATQSMMLCPELNVCSLGVDPMLASHHTEVWRTTKLFPEWLCISTFLPPKDECSLFSSFLSLI